MHKPVLLNEVLEILDPKPGEFFIDGTLDGGGHARAVIAGISPAGRFLGVDWDGAMLSNFKESDRKGGTKIILVNDNFKNMKEILRQERIGKADGLLLDLGFSSEQIDGSGRGFSFRNDEPLLMTYDLQARPAWEWLGELREAALVKIIKDFGEERFAGRIAKAIKKNLPMKTSGKLAEIVRSAVPGNYEHGRIHPATRTFQALRIFVNQELENIRTVLNDLPLILNPGARVAVISFHSLEDRIVKRSFRSFVADDRAELLNKKPIIATDEEVSENPRSRSAKLRGLKIL
jgi:16S rRNA (cytosine1402-N4)-methyltransferase